MLNDIIYKGFGGKFISYIGKYMYWIFCYAFVDHTYLLQNELSEYYIIEDVAIEILRAINRWESDLKDIGGSLHPKRFFMPLVLSRKGLIGGKLL